MRISRPKGPGTLKCFLFGWVIAWAAAIYLSCAFIWLGGIARVVSGARGAGAIFAIADAVSPWAKLAIGIAMGTALILRRRLWPMAGRNALAADGTACVLAMLLTLGLLPSPWSAGFGVGLTGARFTPLATALYIAAAAIGGILATMFEANCLNNRRKLNEIYRDRSQ
ncbi:hypothetical protein GRI58_01420 [Porphyrobacter algicida]|uniref:Uncharacterized protein n=1 Tax=Qipengyuania algicida TaxID=1836209 RepID=A0A845AB61_9SPHN|nr:hypothetical protein [Qipengyuania algicida]MXP27480.1 hypothetical protein [Qipengyuania algicida]